MGRKIQARRSEVEIKTEAWDASLKKRSEKHEVEVVSLEEQDRLRREGLAHLSEFFVRDPDRCPTIKSKNADRRLLSDVRYLFNRYPVPPHLDEAWMSELTVRATAEGRVVPLLPLKEWYLCVAQGGSLYKQHAKSFMTKAEVHHFLTCPFSVSFVDAVWYAVARAAGASVGYARAVASTKLHSFELGGHWFGVARWFVLHQHEKLSAAAMNDLIDYIAHRHRQTAEFTLSGQTVEGVKRRSLQWHRDLVRMKNVGGGSWEGYALPDKAFVTGKSPTQVRWTINQIKTGDDLAKEGNAMRHCVAAYKSRCIAGEISIWSLKKDDARALTIEVRSSQVMQARGVANRLPRGDEASVLRAWARSAGFTVASYIG